MYSFTFLYGLVQDIGESGTHAYRRWGILYHGCGDGDGATVLTVHVMLNQLINTCNNHDYSDYRSSINLCYIQVTIRT